VRYAADRHFGGRDVYGGAMRVRQPIRGEAAARAQEQIPVPVADPWRLGPFVGDRIVRALDMLCVANALCWAGGCKGVRRARPHPVLVF